MNLELVKDVVSQNDDLLVKLSLPPITFFWVFRCFSHHINCDVI